MELIHVDKELYRLWEGDTLLYSIEPHGPHRNWKVHFEGAYGHLPATLLR